MELNKPLYYELCKIFLNKETNKFINANILDISSTLYSIDIIQNIIKKNSNYYEIEYCLIIIFNSIFIFNEKETINELFSLNFKKFYDEIKENKFLQIKTGFLNKELNDFFSKFTYPNEENNRIDNILNNDFDFFLKDEFYQNININIKPLIFLLNYIQISKIKKLIELSKNAKEIEKYLEFVKRKIISNPFNILYDFIILVCIIQKTLDSRLYKINKEKGFVYDLSCLNNEMNYMVILIEASKYIPNISKISLSENNLGEIGFFYLGQNINYIQTIKELDLSLAFSDSNSFKFFKIGINNHEIFNIEKIDLSRNLKFDDIFCYHLSLLIQYFPNLKILNLNFNKLLNNKLSYLFIQMKRLYEIKKCKIEELYLNKIQININSLYALIELLKSRYCLIKILSFNKVNFNNFLGKKIFHALTKNKILQEIYFYNCQFEDYQTKELLKTLPLFNLSKISFYNNQFHNFENILKILNKTKKIEINNEKINSDSVLYSIDLSFNNCKNVIKEDYFILYNIIKNMEIKILDISQLLFKNTFHLDEKQKEIINEINNLIIKLYERKICVFY